MMAATFSHIFLRCCLKLCGVFKDAQASWPKMAARTDAAAYSSSPYLCLLVCLLCLSYIVHASTCTTGRYCRLETLDIGFQTKMTISIAHATFHCWVLIITETWLCTQIPDATVQLQAACYTDGSRTVTPGRTEEGDSASKCTKVGVTTALLWTDTALQTFFCPES